MSIYMICLIQAIETLKNRSDMAPLSAKVYTELRAIVPKFVEDQPKYKEIERVKRYITDHSPHISQI
jgi:histidine ammonia-lyase